MNKPLKYTLIVLGCLAAMFICFLLWLQCNPIHIGGANGQVKPAYCSIGEKWEEKQRKKETLKTVEEIKKNLEFTCVHEKRPSLSEETQQSCRLRCLIVWLCRWAFSALYCCPCKP